MLTGNFCGQLIYLTCLRVWLNKFGPVTQRTLSGFQCASAAACDGVTFPTFPALLKVNHEVYVATGYESDAANTDGLIVLLEDHGDAARLGWLALESTLGLEELLQALLLFEVGLLLLELFEIWNGILQALCLGPSRRRTCCLGRWIALGALSSG